MGLSGSRSTSTSISLPGLASPRATEPNTAAWDAPSRFNSLSWVRKVRRTSLSTPVIFQPCGKAHRKSASEKRVGKARQPELRNFIGAVLIADKAAREIASVQADQFPHGRENLDVPLRESGCAKPRRHGFRRAGVIAN